MRRTLGIITLAMVAWSGSAMAQDRPDLLYCGSTGRTGAALYSGLGALNEVDSCLPDGDTQAMLVTRHADTSGLGDEWLAYLNAGGIIITEYSITHSVYNEIYGTSYVSNIGQTGDCYDNAMPSRKINPSHPFWLDNPIPETNPDITGCSQPIDAIVAGESEVTPLGGWTDNDHVYFACREQGNGTFYLLDVDWQDGQAEYSDDSREFMAELITRRSCGTGAPPAPTYEPQPIPAMSAWSLAAVTLMLAMAGYLGLRRRT